MKRYTSGTTVRGGYYWNLNEWEIVTVQGEAGVLEGQPDQHFVAVPLPVVPVLVAVMAGLGVCYVPAIGFVMIAYALGRKAGVVAAPTVK